MKFSLVTVGLFGIAALACQKTPEGLAENVLVQPTVGAVTKPASDSACFDTSHTGAQDWIDTNCGGNGGTYSYSAAAPDGNHCMQCNASSADNGYYSGYPQNSGGGSYNSGYSSADNSGNNSSPSYGGGGSAESADERAEAEYQQNLSFCGALAAAVAASAGAAMVSTTSTGVCAAGMLATFGTGEPFCLVPAASALASGAVAALGGAAAWLFCRNLSLPPIRIDAPPAVPARPFDPFAARSDRIPARITQPGCAPCPAGYWGPRHVGHVHAQCTDVVAGHSHWMEYNQTADCKIWGPHKNPGITLCYGSGSGEGNGGGGSYEQGETGLELEEED